MEIYKQRIEESDLTNVTAKSVRKILETEFNVKLDKSELNPYILQLYENLVKQKSDQNIQKLESGSNSQNSSMDDLHDEQDQSQLVEEVESEEEDKEEEEASIDLEEFYGRSLNGIEDSEDENENDEDQQAESDENTASENEDNDEEKRTKNKKRKRENRSSRGSMLSSEYVYDSDDSVEDERKIKRVKAYEKMKKMKQYSVSADLKAVIGDDEDQLPPIEILRRIHRYIKRNNLRDTMNGNYVRPDEKLRLVLGEDNELVKVTDLARLIYKYILPAEILNRFVPVPTITTEDMEEASAREKSRSKAKTSKPRKETKRKQESDEKEEKKSNGKGMMKPLIVSDELSEIINSKMMARPKVVKELWAYIKEKNLQDPSDRRFILCDEPLQKVMGVKRVSSFKMNKYLAKHLWHPEEVVQKGKERK